MSKKQSNERRSVGRKQTELRVNIQDIDQALSGTIMNLGQGGLFIRTDSPPQCWSNITVEFALPGKEEPIRAEGVVVWVVDSAPSTDQSGLHAGIGVQFKDLAPTDLEVIRRYLEGSD